MKHEKVDCDTLFASTQVVRGTMPARDVNVKVIFTANSNGTHFVEIDDYETSLGLGFVGMNVGLRSE